MHAETVRKRQTTQTVSRSALRWWRREVSTAAMPAAGIHLQPYMHHTSCTFASMHGCSITGDNEAHLDSSSSSGVGAVWLFRALQRHHARLRGRNEVIEVPYLHSARELRHADCVERFERFAAVDL